MKKRIFALLMVMTMFVAMLGGCGSGQATWTVTCPWAESGVASMVSQKAAALSTTYSEDLILVAEAIKGDAATVNSWVAETGEKDTKLVFAGEGLFAITPILDAKKLQFTYDNFTYVENLYSSVFVMSADATLNLKTVEDLKNFLAKGEEVSVAVNGATSSEAFLAAALLGAMGYGEQLKLVAYTSAAEAAQAVAKGETDLAVSHQSQILETYQQGGVTIVCAFDGEDITGGAFDGVEGVGKYGYPYFRNRCFIMAPAGASEENITALRNLYKDILSDAGMTKWLEETMLLEVDRMTEAQVKDHIKNVSDIVTKYYDYVVK